MQPTEEQVAIIDAAQSHESLKIYAAAGSGKTTTMKLCAEAIARPSLYIAFNKSVADEARGKFPRTATVATAHSLAFRDIGRLYKNKIVNSLWRLKRDVAPRFEKAHAYYGGSEDERSQDFDHVLETFNSFLASADFAIGAAHIPKEARDSEVCAKLATLLWRAATDTNDPCPITHDVYFKLWQLSMPRLPFQTILIDEAQDLSPVMLDIVSRQQCQKIFVGDPYQQIYAWRGAVNALESVELPFFPLTASFRFGQQVADVANAILACRKAPFTIKGLGTSEPVKVGYDADATGIVARSNAGLVAAAVRAAEEHRQIHFFGGVEDLVQSIEGAFALFKFGRSKHELFSVFKNFAEAQKAAETPLGSSFRPFVKLVESYKDGTPLLASKLRGAHVDDPMDADVRFGTTHKFKGQEADRLLASGDYMPWVRDDEMQGEDANLIYVAITRAKGALCVDPSLRDTIIESIDRSVDYWDQLGEGLSVSPRTYLPPQMRQPPRIVQQPGQLVEAI
jgi:hypothetical protein